MAPDKSVFARKKTVNQSNSSGTERERTMSPDNVNHAIIPRMTTKHSSGTRGIAFTVAYIRKGP